MRVLSAAALGLSADYGIDPAILKNSALLDN